MGDDFKNFLITITFFTLVYTLIVIGFKVRNYYTINQAHIVCNEKKCEISHINLKDKRIVMTEKLDINAIKDFEYRYEKNQDSSIKVYLIYANRYDGTSYPISPLYVQKHYEDYVTVPVAYLNEAIKKKPLNIDLYFPENSYFPEYGY